VAHSPKHRSYGAHDVFSSAMQFNATCEFLLRVDHKKEPQVAAFLGHPIIALSALTLELLLKTLHALHSDNPVPGHHHLANLFRGLDRQTQREIQLRWDPVFTAWRDRFEQMRAYAGIPSSSSLSSSVEAALEAGSRTFEQSRYSFERPQTTPEYFVDRLRHPLIALITERKPEFAIWTVRKDEKRWDELSPLPEGGKT
jgi:hypothetical protein